MMPPDCYGCRASAASVRRDPAEKDLVHSFTSTVTLRPDTEEDCFATLAMTGSGNVVARSEIPRPAGKQSPL